ncbi:hypothetical protein [Streptomyces sp. NPDC005345]|uniref:hypothetical protein n=1 Tax=Streptomyces sp. NPDC005345 TaxID=3156877 RepID=UPI0033A82CA0
MMVVVFMPRRLQWVEVRGADVVRVEILDVVVVDGLNGDEGQPLRRPCREGVGLDLPAEEAEVLRAPRVAQRAIQRQLAGCAGNVAVDVVRVLGRVAVCLVVDRAAGQVAVTFSPVTAPVKR